MKRFVWSIFGLSGSGKTELWKWVFDQTDAPRFVLDRSPDADLAHLGTEFETAEQLRLYLIRQAEGSVPPPKNDTYVLTHATKRTGSALFQLAREAHLSGTFVVDEAHHWYNQRRGLDEGLDDMLEEGRKDGQSIIATARRPQSMGMNLRNEGVYTSFAQQDTHAQKAAARMFPPSVKPIDLGNLGQYEYITHGRLGMLPFDIGQQKGQDVPVCRLNLNSAEIEITRTLQV